MKETKLILASASPRRRDLMHKLTDDFFVMPADTPEDTSQEEPDKRVMELAGRKAKAAAAAFDGDALVIGADTIVVFRDEIFGKPKDEEDAVRMLSLLSGNTHTVYTGVALYQTADASCEVFFDRTDVTFLPLSEKDISDYVKTGEPFDKAGAYAVQGAGARFIDKICGNYDTVVGLPLSMLWQKLKERGLA